MQVKLENDPNVETFLWFLDDGYYGDDNIERLIDLTRDPDRFLTFLAADEKQLKRNRLGMAADGLATFLTFCKAFDSLLLSCGDNSLLQSALWHYHAYWKYDGPLRGLI